jgi:hypothetical protein
VKVNAGLDEVADDQAALSQQQREEAEAQIMADALMIERAECSVIWHAEAKGEVIDFRADTSPQGAARCAAGHRAAVDAGNHRRT